MSPRSLDRGTASMETVLLTPVLALGALFVVWAGRAGQSVSQLEQAADRGARAASLVSRARMVDVGRAGALADLVGNGVACRTADAVVVVLADRVVVTVRCTLETRGLTGLPTRTMSASAAEPIDVYRAD